MESNQMLNATKEVKDGKLIITVDLNGETKPSTSGATTLIASANHEVVEGKGVPAKFAGKTIKFGLNVFFK
jgi:hypothetical protein